MRPLPVNKAGKYVIPGFALYGRDLLVRDRSLLLCDLIGSEIPVETISPRFCPITVTGCRSMSIISAKFVTNMVNRATRIPGAHRYGGHN
jgi:hypothetical protein